MQASLLPWDGSPEIPRCPSPSCCSPHPTSYRSPHPFGPSWCPSGGDGCVDVPEATVVLWRAAPVPHRANVWITVWFKRHPAGNQGDACWDKENQECWMRCNSRRECGQKVQQQSSPPYILVGQGPSHLSPGSSHSLAASSREHNEKCNPSPAQHCTKGDTDGTEEQQLTSQLLDFGKGNALRSCCLSSGRHHTCQ